MTERIGDVYNTTVLNPTGPMAIGENASADAGISIDDVGQVLAHILTAAASLDGTARTQVEAAVTAVQEAVDASDPDAKEVIRRAGKLRAVAEKIGVGTLSAATTSAITTLTQLAVQGAFDQP